MTITLANATVASLVPPWIKRASVTVSGGVIVSVTDDTLGNKDSTVRIDCTGRLIMPGNVCGHTHLYSSLARGMPGPTDTPHDFRQVLERVWWKLDRALDTASIRSSGLIGALDAIHTGTTSMIDHHASPNEIEGSLDILADAVDEVGVRAALCYEVTDRGGPERRRAGIRENERFLRTNRRNEIRGMVGAHASFTLEDNTLLALSDLAQAYDTGVHIHVAEDSYDQTDSVRRYGKSVVARLSDSKIVNERMIAAHVIHVDTGEIAQLQAAGSWIAHNCRSNMNNSVGRAPVRLLGERVTLGTDGIDENMYAESQAAYFRSREDSLDAGADKIAGMLGMGARCVSNIFSGSIGSLEPGGAADLVILNYDSPTQITSENLAWHFVFGLTSAAVESVMVAGRWIMRNREVCTVDEEKVRAESRGEAMRLWARIQEL